MKTLLAVVLALLLDVRVAFWSRAAAFADRLQHHAAQRYGRAVCARWP